MPRTYMPHAEKHKRPKGYGSLCPKMPADVPADLLRKAISVPGVGANKLHALVRAGHISRRDMKTLRTQRELPEGWP